MSDTSTSCEYSRAERQALADALKENAKLRKLAARLALTLKSQFNVAPWERDDAGSVLEDAKKEGLI